MIDYIRENREKKICIIVSGDTGFYSLLSYLSKNFKSSDLNVIPGISSYQYLFSKIGEVWQNYKLLSVHGREMDYVEILKKSKKIVLLTDDKNTPYSIAKTIFQAGLINYEIIVGERLSYPDEKIVKISIKEFEKLNKVFQMNIVIVREREN